MTRNIIVVPYDPHWAELYEQEKQALCAVFGQDLLEIYHIGSTSIPGIKAKPVIDILPVVKDIQRVDDFNDEMAKLGYEAMGEYGIPGRRYFRKGTEEKHSHHVHAFQQGSPEIARHVNFCAYLRAHPEDAKRYSDLKEELAKRYPHDIGAYSDGKDALIAELDQKAKRWMEER